MTVNNAERVVEVPWQQLSEEALAGVVEEFITREGTDYGVEEFSLAQKVTQVMAQIRRGDVLMMFDRDTERCQLEAKHE